MSINTLAAKPQGAAKTSAFVLWTGGALVLLLLLTFTSIQVGATGMNLWKVITGASGDDDMVLFVSRIPRTAAVLLSGSALAVAGLLMQLLVQNRFVEPSTTGVSQSAGLGLLVATIFLPNMALGMKFAVAVGFALVGTMALLLLLEVIPHRDIIVVPLLGIVLSGIIGAGAEFIAWRFNMQGLMSLWLTGDFSGVLKGRYELLWIVGLTALIIYFFADVFTVVGLGDDIAKNLGVNTKPVRLFGLALVAIVAGITTVVIGTLPFLGLVVPNLVSLVMGDYARRSLPLIAVGGAVFALIADLIGRTLIAPAEIPVGVVMGVLGAGIFLVFILKTVRR